MQTTLQSLDMFASVVAIMVVVWVFAQIWAHLVDELLWWATPTKVKVVIKHIQWNVAKFFAHLEVWNYNQYVRLVRHWANPVTLGLRANAEVKMRAAIEHAENYLEELSLLLNGIQE